jgi:pyruvate/2-oxoglutarate dehydrogenase complex dihydrolipoamide acyltransferase (E2) component
MNANEKLYHKKISIFAICYLLSAICACTADAAYDPSINVAGEPKWDRFIVNDKNVDWSANGKIESAKAKKSNLNSTYMYQSYDENSDSGFLYGRYDPNSAWEKNSDNRALYGKYDNNAAEQKAAAPVRDQVAKPAAANPENKAPAKAKKPAASSGLNNAVVASGFFEGKQKNQNTDKVKPAAKSAAKPVANNAAKVEVVSVQKAQAAKNENLDKIVSVAGKKGVEDFCDYSRIPDKTGANLPPGYVLMVGAPNKVNCKK